MPLGLLDLSLVTDALIGRLKDWKTASGLWTEDGLRQPQTPSFDIDFTGLAPDAARNLKNGKSDCHVSVYLFHVAADKHYRNTFPLGGSAQTTPPQPLALTLYYLLTAYSEKSYIHEQQAMSVALKCFHENPIVSVTIPGNTPAQQRVERCTLTIEPETVDEISRLWQAVNAPLRLSAVYRVGVVFIEAPAPVEHTAVRHEPGFLDAKQVQVVALASDVDGDRYVGATTTDPTGLATLQIVGTELGVDTTVKLRAQKLDRTNVLPDGREFQVAGPDSDTLVLRVPLYTPQGAYVVTVTPAPPADQPQLTFSLAVPERIVLVGADATGLATIAADDAGFDQNTTQVFFGASGSQLAAGADPPQPGQFHVLPDGKLRLRVPAGSPAGRQLVIIETGSKPTLKLWVDKIAIVTVDATGLATIAPVNAGFVRGVTQVRMGAEPGSALAETTNDPPAAGQFCIVPGGDLHVRVPAGTPPGRRFTTVRTGSQPVLELWLGVPWPP